MIIVVSPAKTLDFDSASFVEESTRAAFLPEAQVLVDVLRGMDAEGVMALMGVSQKIADLNVQRMADWTLPFDCQNAKQAVFAFKGDVYTGLAVEAMSKGGVDYLQGHLRILSGLYGLLKPLDLMQAYRLEMGTRLTNPKGKNLYEFWAGLITDRLNKELSSGEEGVLVNLASNEYFKSVQLKKLQARVVTPVFRDEKNGKYKIISFYAKKARGLMVRYAADHDVRVVEQLKGFNYAGYRYSEADSSENEWVFERSEKVAKAQG